MEGLCITDAVKQFGVTSKTLRYYERVGLLEAKRSGDNNYRYYDKPEEERIKQIMILRKMQISIKDIIRIYENEDMCAGDTEFVESVFAKCGYAATYVLGQELSKNKEMYKQTLMAYIDKGIPVIAWGSHPTAIVGVFVGYEEYGKTLLYITGNKNEPERISFGAALSDDPDRINENNMKTTDFAAGLTLPDGSGLQGGWIFVGDKIRTRPIKEIYREAVQGIYAIMTKKPDTFAYGPQALRAWAGAIETGWFENVKPDEFDGWGMHTNFICVLATNGSCIHNFLWRAKLLNPDMTYLDDIKKLYKRTADIWNNDNGNDLEALGGGFNVTLEALQNKEKRKKIATKINEAADCIDEVVQILWKNL